MFYQPKRQFNIYIALWFYFTRRSIVKQDITSKAYQAKVLGELFKSYGFDNLTPVPSKTNYDLAILLMQGKGGSHEKHICK